MIAERSDVSEELARLSQPRGTIWQIVGRGGEAGKKLDFLLQEMQREANTLLSKYSGRGVRGTGDHGPGAGSEIRYRETAGTGAKRRMTLAQATAAAGVYRFRTFGVGQIHAGEKMLEVPGTMFSRFCTTRPPPRQRKAHGKWYDFGIRRGIRSQGYRAGEFWNHARVFGKHQYGTPPAGGLRKRSAKAGFGARN